MEKMTWSGGDALRAVLLVVSLALLGIPIGPRSLEDLRRDPPSQRLSVVRLALRGIGAVGFLVVAAWYVSALHWSECSVARYLLAERLRASTSLPTAGTETEEDRS
jgi:hypothetical protein